MNRCSFSAALLSGALLLALANAASAVPFPRKPTNHGALHQLRSKASANQQHLLLQHAATSRQHLLSQQAAASHQHLLSQAAAARQHHLLSNHTQTSRHLLLKSYENFFKLHLLEEARRPVPPPPPYGYEFGDPALDRAPVTRIRPPAQWTQPAQLIQPAR